MTKRNFTIAVCCCGLIILGLGLFHLSRFDWYSFGDAQYPKEERSISLSDIQIKTLAIDDVTSTNLLQWNMLSGQKSKLVVTAKLSHLNFNMASSDTSSSSLFHFYKYSTSYKERRELPFLSVRVRFECRSNASCGYKVVNERFIQINKHKQGEVAINLPFEAPTRPGEYRLSFGWIYHDLLSSEYSPIAEAELKTFRTMVTHQP